MTVRPVRTRRAPDGDRAVRVLVLGDRPHVALAACRALGRHGYEVGVTGSEKTNALRVSRYSARYHRIPGYDSPAGGWREALAVATAGYDVIIATSDAGVEAVTSLDAPAAVVPRIDTRRSELIDKGALADLCTRLAIPYPHTVELKSDEDDHNGGSALEGPRVVKAARPAETIAGRIVAMPGARVVRDHASLLDAAARVRRQGHRVLVQPFISGDKYQAIAIRRSGVTTYKTAFAIVREYPPGGGAEAMLESVPAQGEIGSRMIGILEQVADAGSYEGILAAEFIRRADSHEITLLDLNPRLPGSLRFAELLGHRLTERVVNDALAVRPPDYDGAKMGRYHHLAREIYWLTSQRSVPHDYLASFRFGDVWDLPSITDPLPDLLRLWRRARSLGRLRR